MPITVTKRALGYRLTSREKRAVPRGLKPKDLKGCEVLIRRTCRYLVRDENGKAVYEDGKAKFAKYNPGDTPPKWLLENEDLTKLIRRGYLHVSPLPQAERKIALKPENRPSLKAPKAPEPKPEPQPAGEESKPEKPSEEASEPKAELSREAKIALENLTEISPQTQMRAALDLAGIAHSGARSKAALMELRNKALE